MNKKADYGFDAPNVIRNLFVIGILCMAVPYFLNNFSDKQYYSIWLLVIICLMVMGLCLTLTGIVMIFSSKIGKLKERERILNILNVCGDENILDVGCGRGLYLVGAAKRLVTGKITGIDIWQSEDLSGNHMDNTIKNAVVEGVRDKVKIETADMRKMPFESETFDMVLSSFAIHNIYDPLERRNALLEITRVLKVGGKLCIIDMRHADEYARVFSENGICDIKKFRTNLIFPIATVIIGTKC